MDNKEACKITQPAVWKSKKIIAYSLCDSAIYVWDNNFIIMFP